MAVGWKACTKKPSAISWIKGPAGESGAFFVVPQIKFEESLDADVDRFSLAISFSAMLHGEDFDGIVEVAEAEAVVAETQAEFWWFDVMEPLYVAFASGDQAGQGMENA
jgi:hypothetical protein